MAVFEPKTVENDVFPAGEPAAGGLAHMLPQCCLARCRYCSVKSRKSISMVRVDFLGFVLLLSDISRLDRYSIRHNQKVYESW